MKTKCEVTMIVDVRHPKSWSRDQILEVATEGILCYRISSGEYEAMRRPKPVSIVLKRKKRRGTS